MKDVLTGIVVTFVLFLLFSCQGAPQKEHNGKQQGGTSGAIQSGGLGGITTEITQPQTSSSAPKRYQCVKSFQISVHAPDGTDLHRKVTIPEGGIYEASDDLLISSAPAIHLEQVDGGLWLEISQETLKKYFIETN